MRPEDKLYLGQMHDMAAKIVDHLGDKSQDQFDEDELLQFALVHMIQVFGEAARRVSDETRQEFSEIPWREIVGMRHKLVHDYTVVDLHIVWDVARHQMRPLLEKLRAILNT